MQHVTFSKKIGIHFTRILSLSPLLNYDIWANDLQTTVDCNLVPRAGTGGTRKANPLGGICANGDLGIIMVLGKWEPRRGEVGTFGICANKNQNWAELVSFKQLGLRL